MATTSSEIIDSSKKIAQASVVLVTVVLVTSVTYKIDVANSVLFCLSALAAMVPFSLVIEAYVSFMQQSKRKIRLQLNHNLRIALRSALASNASELILVLIGLVAYAGLHAAPAITPIQILMVDVIALVLPITALRYDDAPGKSLSSGALLSRQSLVRFVSFGAIAAVISYGNYWLFFARHHLSFLYLDYSLPLYHQATTLTCATLVLCFYVYLLFERIDNRRKFFASHLWSNQRLVAAFFGSLIVLALVIYTPPAHFLFSTASLSIPDVLLAIASALLYLGCRLLQRYTNKHSRESILELYHELKKEVERG